MDSKKNDKNKRLNLKNRRAFTLVELLAVIVILGLLLSITIPAVSSYINQTRDDTYSMHEANMKVAASNMMSVCEQKGTENCIPESGNSRVAYLSELIEGQYSGRLKDPADTDNYCSEDESYVVVTNTGNGYDNLEYSVCLKCSNYESDGCSDTSASSTNSCSNDDDVDPVCGEVVGGSTLWTNEDRVISVGCSDSDCGCTQTKYYKTFAETATTGEITIRDKAGNETSCSVNVYVDKDEPTCTLSVSGTLGENGWYGGEAPVVTLTSYTDGESGVATYGMGTSKSNYNFDKTTSYTVSTGITTVYGYVKDNAGNVGTCSVEVKYDNAIPTEDTYYGYQVYTKEDITTSTSSTITINSNTALKEGSNILSEYGNIYGIYVYPTSDSPGMTVTVNGETRTISSGVTTPTYIEFDSAFTGSSLTINVSNNRVSYISKIEVVTQSTSGYYTNKNVTLYIHSKDSLSGKAYYSFDNGSTWSTTNYKNYSSNTGSLTLKTKDIAGNVSNGSSMNINNIDKVAPTCTVNFSGTLGNNNWYTDNVTVSLTRSDSDSGVRYYGVSTSGLVYDNSTKTQTADTAGTEWTGYVIDKAGNTATCKATVKKDATPPTCTLSTSGTMGSNSWYTSDVTISLTKSDTGGSELSSYGIGTSQTASYNSKTSMSHSSDTSSVTYYGYVKDGAGNTGICSTTFKRDATAPSMTVTIYKYDSSAGTKTGSSLASGSSGTVSYTTWKNYGFYIAISNSDSTSGLDDLVWRWNASGSSSSDWNTSSSTTWPTGNTSTQSASSSMYVTLTAEGDRRGILTLTDNAGNETVIQVQVLIDKTAPSCSNVLKKGSSSGDTYTSGSWYNGNVYTSASCSDTGGSGCSSTKTVTTTGATTSYSNSSQSSVTISNEGTTSVTWKVYDNAGNSTTCGTSTVKVDKTAPSMTVTIYKYDSSAGTKTGSSLASGSSGTVSYTTWKNYGFYIDISASDSTSGLDDLDWRWNASGSSSSDWTTSSSTTWPTGNTSTQSASSSMYVTLTAEGDRRGILTLTDNAGNETVIKVRVLIDKTAPTMTVTIYKYDSSTSTKTGSSLASGSSGTVSYTTWKNYGFYIDISASDSKSGLDDLVWRWNASGSTSSDWTTTSSTTWPSGNTNTQSASSSMYKTLTAAGDRRGILTLTDNAGNETVIKVRVLIDKTKPTCSISVSSNVATLSCSDSGGSGLNKYYWGTSSSGTPNTSISSTELSTTKTISTSGTYYLFASDNAGNVSSSTSKNITACGTLSISASCSRGSPYVWTNSACFSGTKDNQEYLSTFTLSGCTDGLNGYVCYYNPDVTASSKQSDIIYYSCNYSKYVYTSNTVHATVTGTSTGTVCFNSATTWYYYRSTEYTYAYACNSSDECASIVSGC